MMDHGDGNFSFSPDYLEAATAYLIQVKAVLESAGESEWSDSVEFATLEFNECVWKECPDNLDEDKKYSVDAKNARIVTKSVDGNSTIIGNTSLPPNKVTLWNIKVLKLHCDGRGIYVGVAPFDINQDERDNYF